MILFFEKMKFPGVKMLTEECGEADMQEIVVVTIL